VATKREHLLVDGYNLIKSSQLFQAPDDTLEQARLSLQQTLDAYGRRAKVKITLYYDGDGDLAHATQGRYGDIEFEFSRYPEKADDLIMRAAQDKHGAKWLRVISSDREIRHFAARHKIRSTSSEDFLDELEAPLQKKATPTDPEAEARRDAPGDLAEWERLFVARPAEPKPGTARESDGTESDLRLEKREVDEWEELFRKRKGP
jgi:predicted RNA-binding protein with PIN domain